MSVPLISGVVLWLKAEKRRTALWPSLQLVDILRGDPCLDHQAVGIGHDQHDRLAGRDHTADRVHGGLVHHAVLRRADVDALELVLGRDLALDQLADLGLDLAQLLADLAASDRWSIWMICSSVSAILPLDLRDLRR